MAYPSKEERIIELFFNEPTKHWHFKDIVKTAEVSEIVAAKWLKKYSKKFIKRIKPRKKMPYYIADWENEQYHIQKKFYTINKLYESGLISRLHKLKAKTIIIFGSFSRTDWVCRIS